MKRVWRKGAALIAACAVLCSIAAVSATAKSGDLTVSAPTKDEIAARYAAIRPSTAVYQTKPNLTAPYAAGKLSSSMLNNALDYLNYLRFLAGMPSVSLSESLTDEAQHGAVLLAASDQFTHYPVKPADMSQAFFDKGYGATSTSNISWVGVGAPGQFPDEATVALHDGIQGCMQDWTSDQNFTTVGHRRWFLNPRLRNVGFGYADTATDRIAVMKIFDRSGGAVDYNYVAWPAQGYFPNNELPVQAPWSISLNPTVYGDVNLDTVKVTIHGKTGGKTWVVDKNTPYGTRGAAYLTVDKQGYGEGQCLIFMPSYSLSDETSMHTGEYTVSVTGLTYQNGSPASIQYTTTFFDVENQLTFAIRKQPQSAQVAIGSTVKTTVTASGVGLRYQWYVKEPGAKTWITSSVKTATYSYAMTAAKSGRQVYCVITDANGHTLTTDTVILRAKTPYFATQPKNVTARAGSVAKTTVKAVGEGLTYRWYVKNPGSSVWIRSSITAATYEYTMTAAKSGRQIYCVVTDRDGNTAKSNVVTLRMPLPEFTRQPANAKAMAGQTVKTSVAASGEGIAYQWYYKNPGATKFVKSSVKTAAYSYVMTSAKSGRQVYCVITDKYGQKVQSNTVTLSIPKIKITSQPQSASAAVGSTVKTAVTASGDGLRYQWYYKNPGTKTFLKSSVKTAAYSYVMTSAKSGRQVYCVITDQYGNTVKTNTVTLKKKYV